MGEGRMKWLNIKDHTPPKDGYYIIRLASNEENSDDFMYSGDWFEDNHWVCSEDWWIRTHFIIPDLI